MKQYIMLIPAGDLANGTIVSKATGAKLYSIQREIVIYSRTEETKRIQCEKGSGTVFLVPHTPEGGNSMNAIAATLEVKAYFNIDELDKFVQQEFEEN